MKKFLLLSTVFMFMGCGIQETAEKANRLVEESNRLQKELLSESIAMRALTDKMTDSVHGQTLAVSLQGMLAPENTQVLQPPFRMMPYAEGFAKEATDEEFAEVLDILYQEAVISSSEYNDHRMISLTAMSAIAGLASQEKFEQFLKLQIDEKGKFEEVAYAASVFRYNFIRDYLFESKLELALYFNLKLFEDSAKHFKSLKYLSHHPERSKFAVKIANLQIDVSIEPQEISLLSKKAKRKMDTKLSKEERADEKAKKISDDLNPE